MRNRSRQQPVRKRLGNRQLSRLSATGSLRTARPQQQTCKVCKNPDKWNFYVPDSTWAAVVPQRYHHRVVCLYCFDTFAAKKGVNYASQLSDLIFDGWRAVFEFEKTVAIDGPFPP